MSTPNLREGEKMFRKNLEDILAISKVKENVYQNAERLFVPPAARGVFGGTLVAQALFAAIKTVPETYIPSSFHSYFLDSANDKSPLYYHVNRLRDGKSFISREVKAYQEDRLVLTLTSTFTLKIFKPKNKNDQELKHFKPPPNELQPFENYLPAEESFQKGAIDTGLVKGTEKSTLDNFMRRFYEGPLEYLFPIDFWLTGREKNHPDKYKKPHEINVNFYLKVRETIREELFHYVALAYFSDGYLLVTIMKFHKRPLYSSILSVSLDHSVYFHKPVNVNEFVLYSLEHPKAGDNRQLMKGHMYNKNHEMVASVIQEGLVVINDELLLKAKI